MLHGRRRRPTQSWVGPLPAYSTPKVLPLPWMTLAVWAWSWNAESCIFNDWQPIISGSASHGGSRPPTRGMKDTGICWHYRRERSIWGWQWRWDEVWDTMMLSLVVLLRIWSKQCLHKLANLTRIEKWRNTRHPCPQMCHEPDTVSAPNARSPRFTSQHTNLHNIPLD